jgi:hypothetical protein
MPIRYQNIPQEATIIAAEALTEALQCKKPPNNLAMLLDPTKSALYQLQQYIHPSTTSKAILEPFPRVQELPRVQTVASTKPITQSTYELVARRTRSSTNPVEHPNFYTSAFAHPITEKLMEYRQIITDPAT